MAAAFMLAAVKPKNDTFLQGSEVWTGAVRRACKGGMREAGLEGREGSGG